MQRINDLLMLIGSVEDKVFNMSNHFEQEIRGARTIVYCFQGLICYIFRAYSLPVPLLGRTRVDKDDKKTFSIL